MAGIVYPTGQFAVANTYNAYGYLASVTRVSDSTALWQANTVSASGKTLTETLGNGLTTTRTYDAVERITSIQTPVVHALSYTYDAIGNVTQRIDGVPNVTENFTYDALNRLLQVSGTAPHPEVTDAPGPSDRRRRHCLPGAHGRHGYGQRACAAASGLQHVPHRHGAARGAQGAHACGRHCRKR